MKNKVYRETLLIKTSDCDLSGRWRPSAVLAAMQEASGMHSERLGCGRQAMLENNIIWVLSRTELVMNAYPRFGETITLETYPMPARRWFFPRHYFFYNAAGEVIGRAVGVWVLVDFSQRSMVSPGEVLALLRDNSDLPKALDFPGNLDDVTGEALSLMRSPAYTDIDVNRHVNNTRYADWLCDALGIDALEDAPIERLLIHYTKEIKPGEDVILRLTRADRAFLLSGLDAQGDKRFEIGGTLMGA